MTVREIREYVDELKKFYRWLPAGYPCSSSDIAHKLLKVRAMLYQLEQEQKDQLDELEPKAKWVKTNEWDNGYIEYSCSKCGHTKSVLDTIELPPFCESCGVRMNDEVEENKNEHI